MSCSARGSACARSHSSRNLPMMRAPKLPPRRQHAPRLLRIPGPRATSWPCGPHVGVARDQDLGRSAPGASAQAPLLARVARPPLPLLRGNRNERQRWRRRFHAPLAATSCGVSKIWTGGKNRGPPSRVRSNVSQRGIGSAEVSSADLPPFSLRDGGRLVRSQGGRGSRKTLRLQTRPALLQFGATSWQCPRLPA